VPQLGNHTVKIAIIGGGVSGMGAAMALKDLHDVTLLEQNDRLGGHADTASFALNGQHFDVDTGFIVYNTVNYPNFCALMDVLGVAGEDSDMSFSVSCDAGRLEYACDTLDKVFAQRHRTLDPTFLRAMWDILWFMKNAPNALKCGELHRMTLGAWLDSSNYSRAFRHLFLYPMGGAIWSTASADVAHFPADAFVTFFKNHELLHAFDRKIQWRTVSGGSRQYVNEIARHLGPRVRLNHLVSKIRRTSQGIEVQCINRPAAVFDQVVLATHSDQALALLQDADADEKSVLARIRYADNEAVLHHDPRLMPKMRKVWSSWNFLADSKDLERAPSVSYWMNRLQNIQSDTPIIVTLNPPFPPRDDRVIRRRRYAHPQFDADTIDAQQDCDRIQGRRGVWFAGAWNRWGFHEDGLTSGLRIAAALGARPAWAQSIPRPLTAQMSMAVE
jgi:predicted NAD/FAD-binding protein